MFGGEFDSFLVLISVTISIAIDKKKILPTLSVSIRSLKKFTTISIDKIIPIVATIVL
jgi:hypothetical protein